MGMRDGDVEGFFVMGENPAVGSANAKLHRLGDGQPQVARRPRPADDRVGDVLEGRARDRDRRAAHGGHRDRGVLPARPRRTPRRTARSPTPSACCSGTTRRSSRPATAASELHFMFHLIRRIREKLAGLRPSPATGRCSTSPGTTRPRAPHEEPDAPRRCCARSPASRSPTARPSTGYTALKGDGSTACGCWIYSGMLRRTAPTRPPAGAPAASRLGRARSGAGRGR